MVKKKYIFGFILFLCLGAIILVLYWESNAPRRMADNIINNIENYRKEKNQLPDPDDHKLMQQLGLTLQKYWYPEYEVIDKDHYRIIILEGFDGPYWTYSSKDRKWKKQF